jgi:hypothetical protein
MPRAKGVAIIETSTEQGVRRKANRPNAWYIANGGLFALGRHLVLSESRWDDAAEAAVERWNVLDEDEQLARYETTTWYLRDSTIEATAAASHLRQVERFANLTGAPFDREADFQTLLIAQE